jgi:hypothetical protein
LRIILCLTGCHWFTALTLALGVHQDGPEVSLCRLLDLNTTQPAATLKSIKRLLGFLDVRPPKSLGLPEISGPQ